MNEITKKSLSTMTNLTKKLFCLRWIYLSSFCLYKFGSAQIEGNFAKLNFFYKNYYYLIIISKRCQFKYFSKIVFFNLTSSDTDNNPISPC